MRPFFIVMKKNTKIMAQAAVIAAMYAGLCYLQNLLLPGSSSAAVQFRAAEALCVLALFSKSAGWGLSVGCLVCNLAFAGALPLDPLVGTLATALTVLSMRLLRGRPGLAMTMPALWNGLLVGWELTLYLGGAFWLNALYVALGELAVMLSLGRILYTAVKKHNLDRQLFGDCAH